MKKILLFLLAISLILFSCSDDAGQKGNLSIRINEMASRHISPVDMDVSYYEILLTHRDQGLNLEYTLQKSSPQMNVELVTGEWNVKAEAYNKDGMLIGGGSATATILPKKNTSVSIPVNEFSGEGTLEVYFDSSTDMSLMLDIYTTKEFSNGDNAGKSIAFTKEDSGYVATTKLINDFYIVEVRDTTDDTIIKRESIRIVKDRITSFRVDSNGNIVINIEDNIEKEPILTLTASDSNAVYEDTIIFSTAVKNIEGPRYIWYLDNVLIEGASESTYSKLIDSSLSEGFHEISCIAISNDKAASACLKFTVSSTSPRPEEIKVKGDVEFIVTQDVLVDNDTEIILTGSNGYRTTFRTQSHVYERGHFDQETTISAKVSTQRDYAYSYYFEIEPSSSLTRVYIVLDRDIEDPGYLRVAHDYHYTFKENQSLGVRFYKGDNRNDDLGILTGVDKRTRTLKLEPGRYETRGSIWASNRSGLWAEMNKESFNIVAGETTEGSIVSNTTARISFNNMDFSNCILIYDSNNGRMDYEYFGYDGNDVWFAPGVYDFTLIPNNEMAIYEAKAVTIYPDTVNALDFSRMDVTPIESTETFGPGNVKIRIDEKVLLPDKTFLKFNFSDSYYGNASEQFIRLESRDFYMESEKKIQLIPVCIDPDFKISLSKGDQGELVITVDREIENPGYLEITYTSSSSDAYGTARNEYNRPMGNTIVGRTAPEKRILKVEPGAYDFSNWYWSNNIMPILSETRFSVLPGETKKIEYSVEYDERF